MAAKRKVFTKMDLSIPGVEHARDVEGYAVIPTELIPPSKTRVEFVRHPGSMRSFDFAPFYGVGIDPIAYACQRQIERFLANQDGEREVITVSSGCKSLRSFFDFLVLRASALRRPLTLRDVDADLIRGYLSFLRDLGGALSTQRKRYDQTKQIIVALGRRDLIRLISAGPERTFPANPFPNVNRSYTGETPLPKRQREAFATAVKTAVMPLFSDDVVVTSELLACALLVVALHTGRNTTPLLEMEPDCLRSHPREHTEFLVLWKRRGFNTSKVALRADTAASLAIEATPSIRAPVVRLIRRVIALTEPLRAAAPKDLSNRVWLYRSDSNRNRGAVTALSDARLFAGIRDLVETYALKDANGDPLRINISRLRKTFANRVFELLKGDLATTAVALGNTPEVAGTSYLQPGENAKRNWMFMGRVLTTELMTRSIGATELTPAGRCTDPVNGQHAPRKKDGTTCFSFLDCLRCRNYVVTGDDLYRVYSFYWRVLKERPRMTATLWDKHYAHIPRLIERDVMAEGVRKRVFKQCDVDEARERARNNPHPFWRFDGLSSLEEFRDPGAVEL